MDVQITVGCLHKAAAVLGERANVLGNGYQRQLTGKNFKDEEHRNCTIYIDRLAVADLEVLRDTMKSCNEVGWRPISTLINALKDPENKKMTSLDSVPRLLTVYLKQNGSPMLHSLNSVQKGVAYAVVDCVTHPGGRGHEPYVELSLCYNVQNSFCSHRITAYKGHVLGMTVPEFLRANELMVPDEDMLAAYMRIMARYMRFQGLHGEQFAVRGNAPEVAEDDYWWRSKEMVDLSPTGTATKGVLDIEKPDDSKIRPTTISQIYDKPVEVPTHPVLRVFSLAHHTNVWVNAADMADYKYEQGLMGKLILPASHSRLIGALVSNLEVLRMESEAEDKSRAIKAKASSSIILAKGPAGTGKTLTAEVYAEEIKRPLYEISAGQLGSNPEDIEDNLTHVLQRAMRLRMPLLINEADVFVQRRGKDLVQNAVVSIFLRLLEYHRGLIFLTTNRADDIDYAILSRCIAEIGYTTPGKTERKKLWQVLLKEFNVELSKDELDEVVECFPKVSGRDIQNLIRLTSRVCASVGAKFSVSTLKDNAVFRSIEILETNVNR
jgi:hypothetical protein